MGALTFEIKSNKNEGLIISPSELYDMFLFGLPLINARGQELTFQQMKDYIKAAQDTIEKYLGIKIKKQVIEESRDYNIEDFFRFGNIKTSFPVRKGLKMEGYYGEVPQLNYPIEWLTTKKSNNEQFYRQINVVPNSGAAGNANSSFTFGSSGYFTLIAGIKNHIPNYWLLKYLTGYDAVKLSSALIQAIGKIASIDLLNILSENILGPGITGSSLSIDGLSQSIQTAKSSQTGAYGARIIQYSSDLKDNLLPTLKSFYKGITMTSI